MFLLSTRGGISGPYLSHEGVKVDPRKIKTINKWKIPTSIKQL